MLRGYREQLNAVVARQPSARSHDYRMIIGDCAQCGQPTEDDELMDFGPFKGQLICADCWSATQPGLT